MHDKLRASCRSSCHHIARPEDVSGDGPVHLALGKPRVALSSQIKDDVGADLGKQVLELLASPNIEVLVHDLWHRWPGVTLTPADAGNLPWLIRQHLLDETRANASRPA